MEKGNKLYHVLDRYIGIIIVLFLGLFKTKKKKIPDEINFITILNLGSIGDNVLMSASIKDIRISYPNSHINVFTGSTNFELVKLIPDINKVVKLSVSNPFNAIKVIRNFDQSDVLIDFGPWPRINSIYSSFIKSNYKIGFKSHNQYRHYIYDRAILHSSEKHEIDNYRLLISPIVTNPSSVPNINVIKSEKVDSLIKDVKSYCVIHPWPGGYMSFMKEWNNEKWISLSNKLYDKFDALFFTGSLSDCNKSEVLFKQFRNEKPVKIKNITGELSLSDTIYFISKADFIFSVNTGISHVAASFNIPQVCLHGPTNIKRWGPVSSNTISVSPEFGTYGYLHFGNEYYLADDNCMDNIGVDVVLNSFEKLNQGK